jgi:hypothetical protein
MKLFFTSRDFNGTPQVILVHAESRDEAEQELRKSLETEKFGGLVLPLTELSVSKGVVALNVPFGRS